MRPSRRNSSLAASILGFVLAFGAPASAQSTIDGSNCIVFVPGTVHGELARCVRLLGTEHPLDATTLTIALMGDAPSHVHSIVISINGAAPFQHLEVDAAPPISASDVGVRFADMNFDGFSDFGIMTRASGAVGPLRWFVFDPGPGKFVASPPLSTLVDPRPDPASGRIVVRRRGARPGVDVYHWQDGHLHHDERIERTCAGGRCQCRHLSPLRHGFALLREVTCL